MSQCADLAGLAPDELALCAVPSTRHKSLLSSLLHNGPPSNKALRKKSAFYVSEKKDWTASAQARTRGLRQLFLQVPASSNCA
jgi:hypothetical protein